MDFKKLCSQVNKVKFIVGNFFTWIFEKRPSPTLSRIVEKGGELGWCLVCSESAPS